MEIYRYSDSEDFDLLFSLDNFYEIYGGRSGGRYWGFFKQLSEELRLSYKSDEFIDHPMVTVLLKEAILSCQDSFLITFHHGFNCYGGLNMVSIHFDNENDYIMFKMITGVS